MRKLLIRGLAGLVLTGMFALPAQAQLAATNNFTTGFTPKELKFVPIDTNKTMRQYNNPNFMANTARNTKAFSLANMLPKINLPGVGNTNRLSNSTLTNSPLMQKSNALQK